MYIAEYIYACVNVFWLEMGKISWFFVFWWDDHGIEGWVVTRQDQSKAMDVDKDDQFTS